MSKERSNLRTLFVDIEASNLAASMGYILCIGYKWSDEKKAKIIRIDNTKEYKQNRTDDLGVLNEFEKIYNEADIVVHHFGDYYDLPFIQTRRLIKGLKKLPDVTTVDTWRICKKKLRFHSNRLEAVLEALNCPIKKTSVNGTKWIEASAGMKSALNYVVDHCIKDIYVLEYVYNKIKAMWPSHPNIRKDREGCKACGKKTLESKGLRANREHRYRRLQCRNCGHTQKGERL